jgi:hypothetical protein
MQKAVRDVGTVLDWMRGTREMLQQDDPKLKALAKQKLGLQTDAQWETKRTQLLAQLNSSMANAQSQAAASIAQAQPPHATPFLPAEQFAAVFQSAMEEHLNDRMISAALAQDANVPAPYGPPEKFDSGDAGWAVILLARLEQLVKGKHVFVHHATLDNFRYNLPENTTVALFADWATGEAPALALKSAIESQSPEFTIHLGDTYYAGFEDELRHNLIACWPGGVQYRKSFVLNGNHEMYSGGHAYFDVLPLFGHSASYFNLGNQYWRLLALDTSWCELSGDSPSSSWGELADFQLDWLAAQIAHAETFNPPAKIILLTHHQLFSAFDTTKLGDRLRAQLSQYLAPNRFHAWFWGHEHRGVVYAPNSYGFKTRCIGHGGFPYPPSSDAPINLAQFPIEWREERCEPDNAWYGMRGFALLRFNAAQLNIDYIDQTAAVTHSEIL